MKIDLKHAWSTAAAAAHNYLTFNGADIFHAYPRPRNDDEKSQIDPLGIGFNTHSAFGPFYMVPQIMDGPHISPERLERFVLSSAAGLTIEKK